MLKFKEFLNEEEYLMIDDVPEQLLAQIDAINSELTEVTEDPFVNSAVFFNLIRNTLERFGVILPPGYEMPMLSMDSETAYTLGDSGYYIYIVHNTEIGGVIGYAQIVNKSELDELMSAELDELMSAELDELMSAEMSDVSSGDEQLPRRWIPPARKDDDSGNTDEYV